jgi:hypothetical protein
MVQKISKYKYYIILYCNKKKVKLVHQSVKMETIMKIWKKMKKAEKPPYVKTNQGKSRSKTIIELALIFPYHKQASKTYTKDNLGRTIEAKIDDQNKRIKEIIPYWREELIYDHQNKKRISFSDLMKYITSIKEFGQIFTLNNNLFVQVDNNVRLFGNKNIDDTQRLFNIVKTELGKLKIGNFMCIKDISTHQRKLLYNILESQGFKRTKLFKHYSY